MVFPALQNMLLSTKQESKRSPITYERCGEGPGIYIREQLYLTSLAFHIPGFIKPDLYRLKLYCQGFTEASRALITLVA